MAPRPLGGRWRAWGSLRAIAATSLIALLALGLSGARLKPQWIPSASPLAPFRPAFGCDADVHRSNNRRRVERDLFGARFCNAWSCVRMSSAYTAPDVCGGMLTSPTRPVAEAWQLQSVCCSKNPKRLV